MAALAGGRFGLAIVDPDIGFMTPADLLRLVVEARPDAALVVFTRAVDEGVVVETLRHCADGFVEKSSGGFVRLPAAVRAGLFSARRRRLEVARDAPYRRLVEGLPVGVFIATTDGEVLEANPALAAILGFDGPEALTHRRLAGFFADPREADGWRVRLEAAAVVDNLDALVRRVDGGTAWVRLSAWVVDDPTSGVRNLHGTVEETGSYHAAQQELARRSRLLAQSNADLEQFAYVVSHDLQQPLAVVSRSLELLSEADRVGLSDDGRRLIEHARRGAESLQRRIDAVLGYSRIDTRGGSFVLVDCNRVLAQVTTQLQTEIQAAAAEITSDELPIVEGDEAQLTQLFQNLLANSLKFRSSAPVRVHVGADSDTEEWVLEVRDNGIGIPAEAADRIFGMFQRLHTEAEYPGTGIGLAICRRIAARHGGRIWVESSSGRGATFKVALPRRPPPENTSPTAPSR
jgi:PAS domain S-box-containing protein